MLVNTLEFSPVIRYGVTTAPINTLEWESWWKEEKRRCIEGFSAGGVRITGMHYFYLNYWRIRGINSLFYPNQKRKKLVPPRFLELDYDFFHEFERARNTGKNMCVAKKRQCGFSEKAGCAVGHEATFFPASQSVIVAGEEKYAKNTMTFVKRGLNALKGTEFFKRRSPDGWDEIMFRYQAYDSEGRPYWKGYMSEIYMLTAKTNPEVVSRFSPSLIVFEETGRFKYVRETYGFVAPSLEAEGEKTGMAFFLGTGGDMDEGVEGASYIFFNPSLFDCMEYDNVYTDDPDKKKICYFVPGWRFYKVDTDGNDLKEESQKLMEENRIRAAKSKDPIELVKEVIARPETPDEIYMIFEGNRFNAMKLNSQRAKILKSRALEDIVTRGNLHWIYDEKPQPAKPRGNYIGVEWEVDPNGPFEVIDPPQRDEDGNVLQQYFAGTDSYDQDDALTSNSMGSISVFNGRLKSYCARLTMRPPTAEEFYEASAKLTFWYECRNLIEFSKIGIFGWYSRKGLLFLLKERPHIVYANVKKSQASNKYGVEPSTKEFWISAYRDYIEEYYENMYDLTQINKALEYKDDKNCDITIGASLAYVHYMDEIEYREEPKTQEEKEELLYYTTVNGILTQKYIRNGSAESVNTGITEG